MPDADVARRTPLDSGAHSPGDAPVPPPPETPDDPGARPPDDAPDDVSLPDPMADARLAAPRPTLLARLARRRVLVGASAAAGLLVALWMLLPGDGRPADAVAVDAEAATARAQWAAMMRRAPTALPAAGVRDTLGPGDAEGDDGRYSDYYTFAARDSAAFSVVVTSAEFAPDLAVRRPDGATIAASTLLRTDARAEVAELRGPGRFEIIVTSRDPRASGVYDLTAGASRAADSLYVDEAPRGDTLGIGAADLRAGRFERVYGVVTPSDAPVVISVVSADFEPRVALIGPTGEVEGNWRTIEHVAGDSLVGVVLRYLPGWDAPYRLIVSSEQPGARGAFAVEARTLPTHQIPADGRPVAGTLGDGSWLSGYRYVDTYRVRVRAGVRTAIRVASDDVAPAFRLFRLERRDDRAAAAAANPEGAMAVETEQALPAGEYVLEVTSGGTPADTARALGGAYTLTVQQTAPTPPPRPSEPEDAPTGPLESRVFGVSGERTGTSGGSTFAVGATQVAVSYPGGRTRVQVSVSVRSVDYTGGWAPWSSFARKSTLVDDDGRRYTASAAESVSPSGGRAEPGTVRRGTVVFYSHGALTGQRRFVMVASIGESSVSLPLTVP